jgi:hypothetical protein
MMLCVGFGWVASYYTFKLNKVIIEHKLDTTTF